MTASTLLVRVDAIRREAVDIFSFKLVDPSGGPLPTFTPGSHIDVHIEPGLVRQYSLCNGPQDQTYYSIAVKREPQSRGGSSAMHERVREGDLITIGVPRNNFALNWDAKHTLLFAGGIGITPMLSMARHLMGAGALFQLHYFSRSLDHTAFHDALSTPEYASKVHLHYALEPASVQHYLRRVLWHRPEGGHLYICGPRPFMDLVEEMFRSKACSPKTSMMALISATSPRGVEVPWVLM